MNAEDTKKVIAAAALEELEKIKKRRIQIASPEDMLKEIFKGMSDPQPAEDNSPGVVPIPQIPPEFPKLLVNYSKKIRCMMPKSPASLTASADQR